MATGDRVLSNCRYHCVLASQLAGLLHLLEAVKGRQDGHLIQLIDCARKKGRGGQFSPPSERHPLVHRYKSHSSEGWILSACNRQQVPDPSPAYRSGTPGPRWQ